jgi:hypothetical protein
MRWDNLFDDLESQLEQGLSAEEVDLAAEEERLRLGRLTVRERVLSLYESYDRRADYAIRVLLSSGETINVRPVTIGKDWFSGDVRDETPRRQQCIVVLAGVASIVLTADQVTRSLNASSRETESSLSARLGLPFVLRDLCRRRVTIELVTTTGHVTGTIDRVGRDHLDIAVHEAGEARRATAVGHYRVVPLAHVLLVRV